MDGAPGEAIAILAAPPALLCARCRHEPRHLGQSYCKGCSTVMRRLAAQRAKDEARTPLELPVPCGEDELAAMVRDRLQGFGHSPQAKARVLRGFGTMGRDRWHVWLLRFSDLALVAVLDVAEGWEGEAKNG